jgi:hypothetical protein
VGYRTLVRNAPLSLRSVEPLRAGPLFFIAPATAKSSIMNLEKFQDCGKNNGRTEDWIIGLFMYLQWLMVNAPFFAGPPREG